MTTIRKTALCGALAAAIGAIGSAPGWAVFSRQFVSQDFTAGVNMRTEYRSDIDALCLSKAVTVIPHVWVPSKTDGTVSKIDARTGAEIARYQMGPTEATWYPTAVATDTNGNAYIACGCNGGPGKIVVIADSSASLRGAAKGRTSFDANGDRMISPTETLDWGEDERVLGSIDVGGVDSWPSCLTFDTNGNLWVGLWNEHSMAQVSLALGRVVNTVPVVGRPASVLADSRGSLWVLSRDSTNLVQVNPITAMVDSIQAIDDDAAVGMAIDPNDTIWIGSSDGLLSYSVTNKLWSTTEMPGLSSLSGVAIDQNGEIWAACPSRNSVVHFADDCSIVATIPVGKLPGGVSMDADGLIWVLNEGSSTAMRIDPEKDSVRAVASTGGEPFSGTSFCGASVKEGISPNGTWRTVVDSHNFGTGWGVIEWSSTGSGTVVFDVRSADDPTTLESQDYVRVSNAKRFFVPNGRYLEVRATLNSFGGASPTLRFVKIDGVNVAPKVSEAVASVTRLSPTGSFESVSIVGVKDPEGEQVKIEITGVTQDEPTNGLSVSDKGPDSKIDGSKVMLRAQANPGTQNNPGNGRVYVISFKATDPCGASSKGKVTVLVPASFNPTAVAINDGQTYDSLKESFQNYFACK